MDKEILEKFKQLGPYKDTVVRNPWEENVIDVEQIHQIPYGKVIDVINRVKETKAPVVFILQGEPGSGKSHLLWRISKNAEEKRFLFINIVPYVSVSGISYITILQSLIESMLKKHPNLKSRPIDHLTGWMVRRGLQLIPKSEISKSSIFYVDAILKENNLPFVAKTTFETIPKKMQDALKIKIKLALIKNYRNIPKYFFQALLMLLDTNNERLAIDFLKGEELSVNDLKKLNLSYNFRMNEEIAYRLLVSFLTFSPFPFVISIDQIETMDKHLKKVEIESFFEKIIRLFSRSGNVLFLLSVQTQTFKKWEKFLPKNIVERLSERTTILPLTLNDAKEIVKKRNSFYFKKLGVTLKEPFYPFQEEDVEKIFKAGNRNPRKLIKAMDHLLETGEIGIEKDSTNSLIDKYYNKAQSEHFNREITDLIMKTTGKCRVIKKTSTYSILLISKTAVVVNNSRYSTYSSIKNLSKALENGIANRALFIGSSERRIRETAIKTNELIEQYEIETYYLNSDSTKKIIGTAKMLRDAEAGDIDIKSAEVKAYAETILKETIPSLYFARKVKKTVSTTNTVIKKDNEVKQVENIISQYKVLTYSNLLKISKLNRNSLNSIIKNLLNSKKIRTIAKGQAEMWIFSNET